ncbi:class I SAM-dependent methyltransferase [Nocardioides nanhaiensis]|uniref:class I SAM-dependent methyltransferase n=1 Tax=Nocardioides nanhaiensis TaxID=1476871 RepID=UPI0031F0D413
MRCVRLVRAVLGRLGVVALLDRAARRSRTALWVRSWLAVYDLDDMLRLDVPWWTFEAADGVEVLLRQRPGARVFEWGSGASTVWLAARAGSVTSVEHDVAWAEQMRRVLPANAELRVVEPVRRPGGARSAKPGFEGLDFTDYVAALTPSDGLFDVVVVDGRAREACLDRALDHVAAGGLLVVDNVDRARYRDALARHGQRLQVEWTRGRTPALPYPTRTALVRVRPADARAA